MGENHCADMSAGLRTFVVSHYHRAGSFNLQ